MNSQLAHNEEGTQVISIEVVDYNIDDLEKFVKQKIEGEVPPLEFKNLDWRQFQLQLAIYSHNKINKELFDVKTLADSHYQVKKRNSQVIDSSYIQTRETILEVDFKASFSTIEIKDGHVEFVQRIPEIASEVMICEYCRNEFIAKKTTSKTCSDTCAKRFYKLKQRASKIAQAELKTEIRRRPSAYIKEDELRSIQAKMNLTLKEAALLLNISPLTLRRWIMTGKVNSNKVGKKHLILRSSLQVLK